MFILWYHKVQKHLPNCLKIAETNIVLIVFNGVICDVGAYPVTVSFCRTTWIRYRKCFIRSMTSYFDHLYSYSKSRWQDKKVYQVLTEFIVTDIPNMAYIVFIDQQKWRWLPPQKVVFVLSIHCLSQQLESTKISLKLWSMLANCMKLFIWTAWSGFLAHLTERPC